MKLVKWRGIVARAKKRGRFTAEDERRARDWPRCAMGERYGFKRGEYDWLSDDEEGLGYVFMHAVEQDDFTMALATIKEIEALPKP